jgi:Taurine catabolism dioxygenase TauD, TfdA family
LNYVPRQILGPDQSGSALSDKQLEALVSAELLARQYQLKLDTEMGDIIFINNYAVLHSREAFIDDAEHQRHLVRLWLKNESLAWTLPAALETGSRRIYQEDDEDGVEEKWVIIPAPRTHFEERHYADP